MRVIVNFFQPVGGHMGVDLGRREICMTQQLLDRPQIGATIQQMSRETVPERVRCDFLPNPRQ